MEHRQEAGRGDGRLRRRGVHALARLPRRHGRPEQQRPGRAGIHPLYCAAVEGAQTSLDPKELLEWMPNYTYGAHAFGLKNIKEMVEQREKILPWIKEYSAIELVTKDDPPIGLYYGGVKGAKRGENHPDPTHSPCSASCSRKGSSRRAWSMSSVYVDQPNAKLPNANAFLIEYLKK